MGSEAARKRGAKVGSAAMATDDKALEIRDWIVDWFGRHGRPIPRVGGAVADVDYLESGLIDSVAMIEFIMDLEGAHHVRFTGQTMADPRFQKLSGLAAIIRELQAPPSR